MLAETIPAFLSELGSDRPIGYVAIDVDYYSSTVDCLRLMTGPPECYLPETLIYCDDTRYPQHNPWQGELLAIAEFNQAQPRRKIGPYNKLRGSRVFKRAPWIDQVFLLHVLDHPFKSASPQRPPALLANPSLSLRD